MLCLKCQHDAPGTPLVCPKCGAVYAKVQAAAKAGEVIRAAGPQTGEDMAEAMARRMAEESTRQRRNATLIRQAQDTGNWSHVTPQMIEQAASRVILCTTEAVPGRHIEQVQAIIAADFAFAFGAIFEEVAGLVRNIAGSGQSTQTTRHLEHGRQQALAGLRGKAVAAGADAVVAVRIDYEEFSGANQRGILTVIATGTAVRLRPPE